MVFSLPLSCNLWREQSQLAEYQRHVSLCLSLSFLHVALDYSYCSFQIFAPAFIWYFLADSYCASWCSSSEASLSGPVSEQLHALISSLVASSFFVHSLWIATIETTAFLSLPFFFYPLLLLAGWLHRCFALQRRWRRAVDYREAYRSQRLMDDCLNTYRKLGLVREGGNQRHSGSVFSNLFLLTHSRC